MKKTTSEVVTKKTIAKPVTASKKVAPKASKKVAPKASKKAGNK